MIRKSEKAREKNIAQQNRKAKRKENEDKENISKKYKKVNEKKIIEMNEEN